MIIGRFMVSPEDGKISYVKLEEDKQWKKYGFKARNEGPIIAGDFSWFDTEFTYMGGGPSKSTYLFVGDTIVAEMLPR